MIIYVDIDNTICKTNNTDYINSKPINNRIDKINQMFENGDKIIYWTARGTLSGINYTELTKKQLENWGCKFHKLKMGKPCYDLFIDDKNINSNKFFNNLI